MAKKQAQPETTHEEDFPSDDSIDETGELSAAFGDLDFDVNEEYKPDPLIPKGIYHGVATKISFAPAQYCIVWDFCLHDNGGVMNDGQTPIDGAHAYFRNWLPKPGDEYELTKSGNNNKRQSKINMMQDFQQALGINMSTPKAIVEALTDQTWIGVEADLDIAIDEYQGRFRNVVNRCKKSVMF